MSQVPNDGLKLHADAGPDPAAGAGGRPERSGIPEGLWLRCPECGDMLFRKVVEDALNTCPACCM